MCWTLLSNGLYNSPGNHRKNDLPLGRTASVFATTEEERVCDSFYATQSPILWLVYVHECASAIGPCEYVPASNLKKQLADALQQVEAGKTYIHELQCQIAKLSTERHEMEKSLKKTEDREQSQPVISIPRPPLSPHCYCSMDRSNGPAPDGVPKSPPYFFGRRVALCIFRFWSPRLLTHRPTRAVRASDQWRCVTSPTFGPQTHIGPNTDDRNPSPPKEKKGNGDVRTRTG